MNELTVFNNPEFGEIRTIEENGAPLFCGSDVAKALGYNNPRDALTKHCKGVAKRDTPTAGGTQELSFIPELSLIHISRSPRRKSRYSARRVSSSFTSPSVTSYLSLIHISQRTLHLYGGIPLCNKISQPGTICSGQSLQGDHTLLLLLSDGAGKRPYHND